jgi:hypothetical protein
MMATLADGVLVIERHGIGVPAPPQTRIPLATVADVAWRRPSLLAGGWVVAQVRGDDAYPLPTRLPTMHPHAVVFAPYQRRAAERLYHALWEAVARCAG